MSKTSVRDDAHGQCGRATLGFFPLSFLFFFALEQVRRFRAWSGVRRLEVVWADKSCWDVRDLSLTKGNGVQRQFINITNQQLPGVRERDQRQEAEGRSRNVVRLVGKREMGKDCVEMVRNWGERVV